MKISPKLRRNIFLNAHPIGLKTHLEKTLESLAEKESFEAPKNVLIIGGSSGYGLASRIVLARAGSHTVNISYEKPYEPKKTGSAGYWNNRWFQRAFSNGHVDLEADAFAATTKEKVIDYYTRKNEKIDLVIYSLAAGARPSQDGTLVRSAIKPMGEPFTGPHLDLATATFSNLTLDPATQEEVNDTVYVMGGDDFTHWVKTLKDADVLAPHVKAITYTYVGGQFTDPLYRGGTLGKAKDDLEAAARKIDTMLKPLGGEALAVRLKAVVTKASMFIPGIAVYGGILFDAMMQNNTHETTTEHIHRLFRESLYGADRVFDDLGRLRLDTFELDPAIQASVNEQMNAPMDTYVNYPGMQAFTEEFYHINGFHLGEDEDVDLDALHARLPLKTL